MALTLFEAAKLSQNPLTKGAFTAIATTDELLAQLPMVPKHGESFSYNREKALPTPGFVAPDHVSLTEGGATFDRVHVPMRQIAHNVDVYDFVEEQQGDTNAQRAMQILQTLKATGRLIGEKIITGGYATTTTLSPAMSGVTATVGPNQDSDRHGPGSLFFDVSEGTLQYRAPGDRTWGEAVDVSSNGTYTLESDNPNKKITVVIVAASLPGSDTEVLVYTASSTNEWDGLEKIVTNVVEASGPDGDELSFELMDRMIDELVKVRENRVFIMPSKLKAKFYTLVRSLGGAGVETVNLPGVSSPVPAYRGFPILQSDWIPTNGTKGAGTNLTDLYFGSLSAEEGLWMGASAAGGSENVNIDPRVSRVLGLRVKDIGMLEDKDARRTRVTFTGALALGSDLAFCRAKHLETT